MYITGNISVKINSIINILKVKEVYELELILHYERRDDLLKLFIV